MKKSFILILFLLFASSYSQVKKDKWKNFSDKVFDEKINLILNKSISYFIFTNTEDCEEVIIIDSKNVESIKDYCEFEKYIFWIENGKFYLTRFNNLGEYFQIELTDKSVFDFVEENFLLLKYQKVIPHIEEENSENKKRLVELARVPTSYSEFTFKNEEDSFEIKFDNYSIEKDSNRKSIGYEFNRNLKIFILRNKILELIDNLQAKYVFRLKE